MKLFFLINVMQINSENIHNNAVVGTTAFSNSIMATAIC